MATGKLDRVVIYDFLFFWPRSVCNRKDSDSTYHQKQRNSEDFTTFWMQQFIVC